MRVILFVLVCLVFSCEDKETSKQNTTVKQDKVEKKTEVKTEQKREYPKLTDDNALQFLSDFGDENKENKVRIVTDFGNIDILLYDKTKYHRANFIFLAKQNYFDYTQFYRVVPNFVIQGGSSDGMNIAKRRRKIGRYLLPPDTKRGYTHKRGAISMPSSEIENAYKLASPYQFFIVNRIGGAPFLDGDYTVFGEVIKGMDVVDKINAVETDDGEWPLKNVFIKTVEILD
ncbi:cyclophilin family peptidyl-prolyl cis-trans isomerase [Winogradskyella wandonensis]|uniref:Peptidyl-prolyl cis-trans isomerase n=1 Tax=Winogradskyella wandonensis TaxID=1442586 RepID=A0A4R1KQA7_9FLAO|nr:peptidylprolyl isomerase [Winogradskyella wandonensis]TCK66663.1 cyclophilin family peptidyl-prolyl cis-trans isomerase [Winogradskyella wandonensis]